MKNLFWRIHRLASALFYAQTKGAPRLSGRAFTLATGRQAVKETCTHRTTIWHMGTGLILPIKPSPAPAFAPGRECITKKMEESAIADPPILYFIQPVTWPTLPHRAPEGPHSDWFSCPCFLYVVR
jgi:hypothetical protein